MVSRAGYPYVATQNVVRGDPAPDASNNSKWLLMGTIAGRALTLVQQIGLTHAIVSPSTLQYTDAASLASALAATFTVSISDRAEITSNVWLQVDISTSARVIGRANRAALASTTNDVAVNLSGVSQSVRNSAAADIIGGSDLRVDLIWYAQASGGAQASRQRYVVPVIAQSSGSAQSTRVFSQNVSIPSNGALTDTGWTIPSSGDFYAVVDAGVDTMFDLPRGFLNKLPTSTAGTAVNANNGMLVLVARAGGSQAWFQLAKTSSSNLLIGGAGGSIDPMPLEIWRR